MINRKCLPRFSISWSWLTTKRLARIIIYNIGNYSIDWVFDLLLENLWIIKRDILVKFRINKLVKKKKKKFRKPTNHGYFQFIFRYERIRVRCFSQNFSEIIRNYIHYKWKCQSRSHDTCDICTESTNRIFLSQICSSRHTEPYIPRHDTLIYPYNCRHPAVRCIYPAWRVIHLSM